MKYICCPTDNDHFATALRRDKHTGKLLWDSTNRQDVLMVQSPYGEDVTERLEEICGQLCELEQVPTQFVPLLGDIHVRYIPFAFKAANGGCALNGEASTYTVFACTMERESDVCRVYQAPPKAMNSPVCDVPLDFHVIRKQHMVTKGFLKIWQRQEFSGFYELHLPAQIEANYTDGSLCYCAEGLRIPITKKMLQQGLVYVKTPEAPGFEANNRGVNVVLDEEGGNGYGI